MSGSAFAHLITLLSLPIVSRLYSESEFGELSFMISAAAILAILLTSRLELAFYNMRLMGEKVALLKTVLITSTIITLVAYLLVAMFDDTILSLTEQEVSLNTLLFIPLAALLLAWYNIYSNYAISSKQFKVVAKTKVYRSLAQSVSQMLLSPFNSGLTFGELFSRFFGIYSLYKLTQKQAIKSKITYRKVAYIINRNVNFIKWSGLSGLFNTATLQAPSIIIASLYDLKAAGLYYMTHRIVFLPSALLGQSLAQVYASEFATAQQPARITLFNKVSNKGLLIGCLGFLPLAAFSQYFIGFILGDKWSQVSEFIVLLTPMLIFQFAVSPISNTLNMLHKQAYMLVWDIARFATLGVVTYVSVSLNLGIKDFLLLYSLMQVVCYVALWLTTRRILLVRKDNGKPFN